MEELKNILSTMLIGLGMEPLVALNPEDSLRDDLDIDSISYAELVVIIEAQFGIDINQNGRAETIGDIIKSLGLV